MMGYSSKETEHSRSVIAAAQEAGFGPSTARAARDAKIHELAMEGAMPGDTARLFGVTRETVRSVLRHMRSRQLTEGEWALIKAVRAGNLVKAGALLGQLIPQGDDNDAISKPA